MIKYERKHLSNAYFMLEIFECPRDIILFSAGLGSQYVTIENFQDHENSSIDFRLGEQGLTITPKVKSCDIDFSIRKEEFISLINWWDKKGCYAVFHEKESIKFKVTNLKDYARYKALDNFGWTLELAIPGPTASGWGHIASPNNFLISRIESEILKIQP